MSWFAVALAGCQQPSETGGPHEITDSAMAVVNLEELKRAICLLLFCLGLTLPLAWVPLPGLSLVAGKPLQFFDGLAVLAILFAIPLFFRKPNRRDLAPLVFPLSFGLSLCFSADPHGGLGATLGSLYLASLACSVNLLLQASPASGRKALGWGWRAGIGLVALGIVAGIAGFYLGFDSEARNPFLFHYGSLPGGSYPRLSSTFHNANLLCDYMLVSLAWLPGGWPQVGLFVLAIPTLSPGLGPMLLILLGSRPQRWAKALGSWGRWFFTWRHGFIPPRCSRAFSGHRPGFIVGSRRESIG